MNSLFYQIAFTKIPFAGHATLRKILAKLESPEQFFREKKTSLLKLGIPLRIIQSLNQKEIFRSSEHEIKFINQRRIDTFFLTEPEYPDQLLHCFDAPILLFSKGQFEFNSRPMLSIIGTRKASEYGKKFCERLVKDISHLKITIVSGLAYGIDICAHKTALECKIPTIAVLAHGLNRLYPSAHRNIAEKMMENGGLLTDFSSDMPFQPGNFPARNRIVAGLSPATVVVESAEKGGSLITADIANSYHRDVFAVPGRCYDKYSSGCNTLIKQHKATMIEGAEDLLAAMNWDLAIKNDNQQLDLFKELADGEKLILDQLKIHRDLHQDELCQIIGKSGSEMSSILLELEFKGLIKARPGNRYQLNS